MTDNELVVAVAEKVMGWRACQCESAYFDSWCDSEGVGQGPVQSWTPLISWRNTMEVVDAMRKQGYKLSLEDITDEVKIEFNGPYRATYADYGKEQRGILEAALKALEHKSCQS